MLEALTNPELWKYLSIPLVAGIVGWTTNWLAIQLTFYPKEFVGLQNPYLGWQGIIPRKVAKMSSIMVDNTVAKLSTLEEFFHELEPEKIARHVISHTDARIEEFVDEVMMETNAVLWENLPVLIKNRVYSRVRKQLPQMMDNLIEDMSQHIEHLIDVKHMIINQMTQDKDLLIRVFKECGEAEFKFVVNSGLWFGGLFGLLQMAIWYFFPEWWILPLFGFLVGYVTNWLALNLIFRPLRPQKFGPFVFQGLFLRRQDAVSEVFCKIATQEVLTIRNLMNAIFKGPKKEKAKNLIKNRLRPIIDSGPVRTAAQLTVGAEGFVELKRSLEDKAIDFSLESFDDPVFNTERSVVVERMFRERMQAMTSEEFQDLLRPAFQEDEWTLILIGAFLGALAGTGQLLLVFGEALSKMA